MGSRPTLSESDFSITSPVVVIMSLPIFPRLVFRSSRARRVLVGLVLVVASVRAQSADQVFSKFLTATGGWQDLSFATSMTTRMMGKTMTMQSRTAMDRTGRSFQEILSGPMRVATAVRGDTIQSKDLQTGKTESRVVPGGGRAAIEQLDPGTRLAALRRNNRFQVESLTGDQTVVKGTPLAADKGYHAVKIAFANLTGMPQWCELQDSSGRATARMDFGWELHGKVQVMKSMKMVTAPGGKVQGVEIEMVMSAIKVNSGLDPALFRLREGI